MRGNERGERERERERESRGKNDWVWEMEGENGIAWKGWEFENRKRRVQQHPKEKTWHQVVALSKQEATHRSVLVILRLGSLRIFDSKSPLQI